MQITLLFNHLDFHKKSMHSVKYGLLLIHNCNFNTWLSKPSFCENSGKNGGKIGEPGIFILNTHY